MALSKTTQDHEEIRQWAEARGGKPAEVASTSETGTGILRIEFPGATNANDSNLKQIEWDEFFQKFDATGLSLVYQDVTAEGAQSNFNKLIHSQGAGPENAGSSARKGTRKAAAKKTAPATKTPGRQAAVKKAAAKKTTPTKAAAKKTAVKKTAAKKTAAKKTAVKKTAVKKTSAKKTATKGTAAKKTSAKKTSKTTARKAAPAKKVAGKKTAAKKTTKGGAQRAAIAIHKKTTAAKKGGRR